MTKHLLPKSKMKQKRHERTDSLDNADIHSRTALQFRPPTIPFLKTPLKLTKNGSTP